MADIQFMFDMEERLLSLTPTTMLEIGTMVTSIGQSSHVWNADALEKKILVDVPSSKVSAKFRKRMVFCFAVRYNWLSLSQALMFQSIILYQRI